jgi:type IV secretion system protein VirB1
MDPLSFIALAAACAPLVDAGTAQALVRVESALNPHAIGVVGGHLERQPRTRSEAITTARALQAKGRDFSVGLAQINQRNFGRLGLTIETAFEPCSNLTVMQTLLLDCFKRATSGGDAVQRSLRQALSCYYSGNFTTGFDHGYTRRVVKAAQSPAVRLQPSLHSTKEVS